MHIYISIYKNINQLKGGEDDCDAEVEESEEETTANNSFVSDSEPNQRQSINKPKKRTVINQSIIIIIGFN